MQHYPMHTLPRRFFLIASFAALLVIGFYAFLGLYYEDNQNIVASIVYAELGTPPSDQWINDFDFLLLPLFGWLSSIFPSLPLYGLWMVLQLFLWLFGLFYFIYRSFRQKQQLPLTAIIIIGLLVLLLTLSSILNQHCVRNSILLCYTGLLYLYDEEKPNPKLKLFSVFLFTVGLLIRIHTAGIILFYFLLLHGITGSRNLVSFRKYIPHFALTVIALGIYHLNGALTTNQGKIIESKYEWALFDKGSLYPLSSMHTAKDSAKYVALKQLVISDSAEMTPDYLARTIDLRYEVSGFLSKENLQNFNKELTRAINEHIIAFIAALLLLLLWMVYHFRDYKTHQQAVVILLLYLGILSTLMLNLVSDLKDRLFAPLTAMMVVHLALLYIPGIVSNYRRRVQLLLMLVFILLLTRELQLTFYQSRDLQKADSEIRRNQQLLYTYSQPYRLLGTINTNLPIARDIFFRSQPSPFQHLGYIDAVYMVYYNYMKQKFIHLFGYSPLNYRAFLQAIPGNTDYRLYASPGRMEVLRAYFRDVYKVTVDFELDSTMPAWSLDARVYRMRLTGQ